MLDPLQIIVLSIVTVFMVLIILGVIMTLIPKIILKVQKQPPKTETEKK